MLAELKASVISIYWHHRDWAQGPGYPSNLGNDRSIWAREVAYVLMDFLDSAQKYIHCNGGWLAITSGVWRMAAGVCPLDGRGQQVMMRWWQHRSGFKSCLFCAGADINLRALLLADGYESLGEVKLAARKRPGLDAFTNRVHLQVGGQAPAAASRTPPRQRLTPTALLLGQQCDPCLEQQAPGLVQHTYGLAFQRPLVHVVQSCIRQGALATDPEPQKCLQCGSLLPASPHAATAVKQPLLPCRAGTCPTALCCGWAPSTAGCPAPGGCAAVVQGWVSGVYRLIHAPCACLEAKRWMQLARLCTGTTLSTSIAQTCLAANIRDVMLLPLRRRCCSGRHLLRAYACLSRLSVLNEHLTFKARYSRGGESRQVPATVMRPSGFCVRHIMMYMTCWYKYGTPLCTHVSGVVVDMFHCPAGEGGMSRTAQYLRYLMAQFEQLRMIKLYR